MLTPNTDEPDRVAWTTVTESVETFQPRDMSVAASEVSGTGIESQPRNRSF